MGVPPTLCLIAILVISPGEEALRADLAEVSTPDKPAPLPRETLLLLVEDGEAWAAAGPFTVPDCREKLGELNKAAPGGWQCVDENIVRNTMDRIRAMVSGVAPSHHFVRGN